MKPGACEIERLPEELLVHVISLTSPVVACCAAAVSSAFRVAADSDDVWSRFLPHDLPLFARKELPLKPLSRKGLFIRLADQPALLPHKFILDKATGTKCFALCARSLQFSRVVSREWCWNHVGFDHNTRGKKFLEAAVFPCVCRFEICGKIHRNMLSQNSTYAAYMVFKIATYEYYYGLDIQLEEASVTVGGHELTRRVCLAGYAGNQVPPTHVLLTSKWGEEHCAVSDLGEGVVVSRRRADGWMELELGEFYNGDEADGEVFMSLRDINGGTYKEDFIVRSIEVRTKHGS